MPKSNAYDSKNVTLRILVNNSDHSRIKKFAKKALEIKSPTEHAKLADELWKWHLEPKCPHKADAHDLSLIHRVLSGV